MPLTTVYLFIKYSLPLPEVLEQDLVQWVGQEKDLVATGVELLDKDTVHQAISGLAHIGDVEDLREKQPFVNISVQQSSAE